MTVVSIHQPNFIPWIGYFQKIHQSDIHVVLDDVLIARRTWVNRVRVLCNGQQQWLTVALDRSVGSIVPIRELRAKPGWSTSTRHILREYYRGSRFFEEVTTFFDDSLQLENLDLAVANFKVNEKIAQRLGLRLPMFVFSSTLNVSSTSSRRLAEIVNRVGGDTYLSGSGASGYLDEQDFTAKKIKLKCQEVHELPYSQLRSKEFVPGLSIVDGLFCLGFDELGRRIRDVSTSQ